MYDSAVFMTTSLPTGGKAVLETGTVRAYPSEVLGTAKPAALTTNIQFPHLRAKLAIGANFGLLGATWGRVAGRLGMPQPPPKLGSIFMTNCVLSVSD